MAENKEKVQEFVKVKKVARQTNLSLDIPLAAERGHGIKKGIYAGVSVSEKDDKLFLIYEFEKKDLINNG